MAGKPFAKEIRFDSWIQWIMSAEARNRDDYLGRIWGDPCNLMVWIPWTCHEYPQGFSECYTSWHTASLDWKGQRFSQMKEKWLPCKALNAKTWADYISWLPMPWTEGLGPVLWRRVDLEKRTSSHRKLFSGLGIWSNLICWVLDLLRKHGPFVFSSF